MHHAPDNANERSKKMCFFMKQWLNQKPYYGPHNMEDGIKIATLDLVILVYRPGDSKNIFPPEHCERRF